MEETNVKARYRAITAQIEGAEARLDDPKSADLSVIEAEICMYKRFKETLARMIYG